MWLLTSHKSLVLAAALHEAAMLALDAWREAQLHLAAWRDAPKSGACRRCPSLCSLLCFARRIERVRQPWLKGPSTPPEDRATPASLGGLKGQAAPTHPGAPPEQRGGWPRPPHPASGRSKRAHSRRLPPAGPLRGSSRLHRGTARVGAPHAAARAARALRTAACALARGRQAVPAAVPAVALRAGRVLPRRRLSGGQRSASSVRSGSPSASGRTGTR